MRELPTIGGARILNRDDIGSLEPGKRADFFSINAEQVSYSGGGMADPVAALIFRSPQSANYTVVKGRIVVMDGHVQGVDMPTAIERLNKVAREIWNA